MKKRELQNIGFYGKKELKQAQDIAAVLKLEGKSKQEIRELFSQIINAPHKFADKPHVKELALLLGGGPKKSYTLQDSLAYACWGDDIDPKAHQQMENACRLPISVKAALMPDAHVGYGLPIGGVLATRGAVIPYAVGVDIACRVMVSLIDIPLRKFYQNKAKFARAIEEETRFGIGAKFESKREHAVLDMDWDVTPLTKGLKALAWSQLGTSGSGNHFVEFGECEVVEELGGLEPKTYLALVSHSGSRGAGARVANHYSRLAQSQHKGLPKELRHLAWLELESDGAEYWAAMELMGAYASANHHLIHKHVLKNAGLKPVFQVENHHNFAWKENVDGEELIVHRKGATPAKSGDLAYIPGTMIDPGYIIEGKGNTDALHSSSHGAGRVMSRKKARQSTTMHALKKLLAENKVMLLSAGLDEAPFAYKNIEEVIAAQDDLVKIKAKFTPKLVKMAPDGERAED